MNSSESRLARAITRFITAVLGLWRIQLIQNALSFSMYVAKVNEKFQNKLFTMVRK